MFCMFPETETNAVNVTFQYGCQYLRRSCHGLKLRVFSLLVPDKHVAYLATGRHDKYLTRNLIYAIYHIYI